MNFNDADTRIVATYLAAGGLKARMRAREAVVSDPALANHFATVAQALTTAAMYINRQVALDIDDEGVRIEDRRY